MTPPAPGRFSTSTGCLNASPRCFATMRPAMAAPRPREHERPGTERRDRRVLALVAARGQRDRLDEGIFRKDALQLLRSRGDEARPRRPARYRDESRPADAAAPLRRGAALEHHLR